MRKIAISLLLMCAVLFGADKEASAQSLMMNGAGVGGAQGGGGWTPSSLGANLVGWYDVSKPVYTDTGCSIAATNGQSIDCVPDQSGNGYNVTNDFSTQSTLNTTGYNGHRVLSWGASGNLQTPTQPVTQFEGLSVASACVVGTIGSSSGGAIGGIGPTPGSATTSIDLLYSAGADFKAFYEFGYVAATTISASTHYRLCMVYNGSTMQPYLNGVAQTPASFSSLTFPATTIDIWMAAGGWNGGLTAEVILVNKAMTGTDVSNFDSYAVAKWGS